MTNDEKPQQLLSAEDLIAIAAAEGDDEVLMLREMVCALAGGFRSERAWKDAVCSKDMSVLLESVTRYEEETDSYMVHIPSYPLVRDESRELGIRYTYNNRKGDE